MKSIILAVLTAMPSLIFAQYTYDKLMVNFLRTAEEAKNFTFENLRLYPIRAKDNFKNQFKDVGKYMALKDAMAARKVKIAENKEGGSVNELTIENISQDTIIIITGEIVKGGKQDRIIEKDMLLEPKSGKKKLPVFCVESGRWTASNDNGENFTAHYSVGTMSLRKVVEREADQQKVWSKVDEINSKNKTVSNTKTYTAIDRSAAFTGKLKSYLHFFQTAFSTDQDVIGVVVVSGDKVLGCDMFATSALFKQNFDNLLHAYATEAIVNGKTVTILPAAVKAYMDQLLSNERVQESTLKAKGNKFEEKGRKLRVTSFD
ncbi:MAG TPA: DUF6569 family protein [Puia sp.]|nr:DUF6569 family protein [Puia sp.]